jgi:hypothetical protein
MLSTLPQKENKNKNMPPYHTYYIIFHLITSIFALYLSFKCNSGFNLNGFLLALFFPHFYIIYEFAISKDFCGLKNV